jgi:hypothetical protein
VLVPLGRHAVAAGLSFPVVLVIADPMVPLTTDALHDAGLGIEATAIVVPTPASLPAPLRARLERSGHRALALSEIAAVDASGALVALQPPEILLDPLRATLAARLTRGAPTAPAWPLPHDARWEELTFRLTSAAELRCTFRRETRPLDPAFLRLASQKNGKPTEVWKRLTLLALASGALPIADAQKRVLVQKQCQQLRDALKAAFGIEADPIPWDARERVYRARFVISDERPKAERERDRIRRR